MKAQMLLRQLHRWGSIVVALQFALVLATGGLLLWKKQLDWVQPPSVQGAAPGQPPAIDMAALFARVQAVEVMEVEAWTDLARVDLQIGDGVVKVVSSNNWEAQFDASTGELLQLAYRRSDLIESLHDGSFFGGWVKLWVFFPAALLLTALLITGVYLFALPYFKRARRRRRRA